MTDRLEEIKQSFENGDYVDFSEDVDWLISEVERLRDENKVLLAAAVKKSEEIGRMIADNERQVKGY